MKLHGSAILLAGVAALIAVLMAVFSVRPASVTVHVPVKAVDCGGIAVVDGRAKIDLNRADASLLMELPGVGAALAQAIIEDRPYKSVRDLMRVKGIGEAKMAGIEERVTVNGS